MPGTSSVEMLEGKSQHRALVGVGELQRLALDLACDLVAQHCPAERRQLPAVIIARQALSAVAVRRGRGADRGNAHTVRSLLRSSVLPRGGFAIAFHFTNASIKGSTRVILP